MIIDTDKVGSYQSETLAAALRIINQEYQSREVEQAAFIDALVAFLHAEHDHNDGPNPANIVIVTVATTEWDNGYFFDDGTIEVTLADCRIVALHNADAGTAVTDALTELSSMYSPLGADDYLKIELATQKVELV